MFTASPSVLGCTHYNRSCMILAPCCNKFYPCHRCHDSNEDHQLDRSSVVTIMCKECRKIQPLDSHCIHCHIKFGEYYCHHCRIYDNNNKEQFHCHKCNTCKVGGADNWIHCDTCSMCIRKDTLHKHICHEDKSKSVCPICIDPFFVDHRSVMEIPQCGHLIHIDCLEVYCKHRNNIKCPICSKSMIDMTSYYDKVHQEYLQFCNEHMKEIKEYDQVCHILCNDCLSTSDVSIFYHKCVSCGSLNTREI